MTKTLKNNPKIALATEFLVQYGGAQKTLEAIAELFPNAPIFTAKYDPTNLSKYLNSRKIISPKDGFINQASKYFFTFLMAPVFESMDFRDYDIIISDGTTWTKGILTKPHQLHISYVHTPPRFLYGYSTESTKRDKWYFKLFFSYVDNILRLWDFVAAHRPEFLIANSKEVLNRIKKFYRLDATVIYPPVDVEMGSQTNPDVLSRFKLPKEYYIAIGRLASYKNFDVLIKAFNKTEKVLVMVGTGASENQLKRIANDNIVFVGCPSDEEKHALIEHSLGLINPVADEDFGIVPVEAMTHGKPVLAHKSGGHLETVIDGVTGMFFNKVDVDEVVAGVVEFDKKIKTKFFDKEKIKQSVQKFSKKRFQDEVWSFVESKWEGMNLSRD